MNIHVGVAVVGLSIVSSIAFAQSLKDKEYFADQEKYLAGEVTTTNERCGNSLTAKFDWLKPPAPEERKIYSAYGYCGAALEAMRRVCDFQAGKEAVKQKIKSLTWSFGPQRRLCSRMARSTTRSISIRATTPTTCSNICRTICERPGVVRGLPRPRCARPCPQDRRKTKTPPGLRAAALSVRAVTVAGRSPRAQGRPPRVLRGEVHRRGQGRQALQVRG